MKQLLLTILFLFTGWTISVAQHSKTKIPKKVLNDIPKLTAYLTKDCQYERQKVDSIHSWITHNIKYDVKYLEKNDCGRFEGSAEVLKSKKTLCMGYVYLMGAMLDELKIEWELISGYTNVSKPYYVPKYLVDNHAWIAIKVEGEWMTADPTWDAGYVGALPKKDRRPSIEKQQKKIDKIIKKNEKLLAAGDELKEVPALDTAKDNVEYSSKIGFVQTGTREWFLVPADSFLTRHLPANPLWQLRLPNLPLEVFSEGSDSIHDFFAANPDQGYVIGVVDHFQQQLLLDKVLANGVMGNQFNSSNTRTKVVHYHHFLEILNIPEVKKNFKGLPELYNRALTQKMIEVSDTTIKLTKSAQAFEKNRHKEVTTACAKGFKNANSANKKFQTSAEKVKKWNEKMLANLEKSDLKLKTDLERLQTADESKSKPEVTPDFEAIAEVHQLVKQLTDSLDR
ncbi:MAG: transglutaminase domain-containing protein, partial [Bacteroidota bacterium]